jgi:uncharacterized iron-regulated membrane protein
MDMRPVFEWVTKGVFDYQSPRDAFKALPWHPNAAPSLDWRSALATGERLMAKQASILGFEVKHPIGLEYRSDLGAYKYEVRSSRDVFERAPQGGSTFVMFDGNTGKLIRLFMPTGERTGNTAESWLYALHMARVFGRPYQIFVCGLGLVITVLSITGIYIWWKKRGARRFSFARRGNVELVDPTVVSFLRSYVTAKRSAPR